MTRASRAGLAVLAVASLLLGTALAQPPADDALPILTEPVTDLAGVIDPASAAELGRLSRALQAATGDTLVVVTVPTAQAYGDIRAYANELFRNHGRGIGEQGKDNGLLILVAVEDRRTWIEVGYGLEGIITDGYAGETSRQLMSPAFREGRYGDGLVAAFRRLAGRIAGARGVRIDDLPVPAAAAERSTPRVDAGWLPFVIFAVLLLLVLSGAFGSRRRRRRAYWGGGPWSGWHGGGFGGGGFGGGGFGGGGFGGGFGGFGGGASGGGGGGSSW